MKVYFMRHGKTDWNAVYKCQGHTNIPLNEEGRQMAREAAERYKDLQFDLCFSSPLDRAYETAEIMTAGRDLEIIRDDRLIEISLGKYEGSQRVLDDPTHPLYPFFTSPGTYVPLPTTESFEEVYARGADFIENVLRPLSSTHEAVLVIAHAVIIHAMINYLRGISKDLFWSYSTKNCMLIEETL